MSDESKHTSVSFLTKWLLLNMLGWIIGTFTVVTLNLLYQKFDVEISNFSPLLNYITMIAIWFPFGFLIGFVQSYQLSQWKIKKSSWIFATTFGWWLPAVIIFSYFESGFYQPNPISPLVGVIIIGASLGASQAFAIRSVFVSARLWVTVNALGACALLLLHSYLLFPSYSYHSTIYEKLIYKLFAESNQPLYYFLTTFTEETGIMFFPLIGTLTIALPTGLLLAKIMGSKSSSKVSSRVSIAG